MKIYIVRHGASTGNVPGTMIGQSDHILSAEGELQAHAVALRLRPHGPMPIYCSDLPRAVATAEVIAKAWADISDESPQPDERLREIDLGEYEGRSWSDFNEDPHLAHSFEAEPLETIIPGGESLAMVTERVLDALEEILETDDDAACIVAHDGPIRCIVNHYLGASPNHHWTITTSHGGLSLIEQTDGWVNLRYLNDICHLDNLQPADDWED